jgi:dienelactone hydrolase
MSVRDGSSLGACRRWRLRLALAWVTALALLFGTASAFAAADLSALLAYDSAAPLNLKVFGREHRPGVLIEDVQYDSASGAAPIRAYLVRPAWRHGPYAGVLFGHWYDYAPNSNRTEFLSEAIAFARQGVVSVLPNMLWSSQQWFPQRSWKDDFASTVGQAKDMRRSLDLLLAQSGVDPNRIAVVGHDFSAMHAALVAAVETRIKAYVLIAGTTRWANWYLYGAADGVPTGAALAAYLAELAPVDPVNTVGHTNAQVMFQFGEQDFFTPRDNFMRFYRASSKASRIATYASEHPMTASPIRLDRRLWLSEQLELPAVDELSSTSKRSPER